MCKGRDVFSSNFTDYLLNSEGLCPECSKQVSYKVAEAKENKKENELKKHNT